MSETQEQRQARYTESAKGRLKIDYRELIEERMSIYSGDLTVFESAVGALFLCQLYGWKVAEMIHSPITYRRYQTILGLKFRDIAPDYGVLAERANVYKIEQSIKGMTRVFNRIARGELGVPGGRTGTIDDLEVVSDV